MKLSVSSTQIIVTDLSERVIETRNITDVSYLDGLYIYFYAGRSNPVRCSYESLTEYNGSTVPLFSVIKSDIEAAMTAARTVSASVDLSSSFVGSIISDPDTNANQAKVAHGDDIVGTDMSIAVADANAIGHLANIASDIGAIENTVGDVVQTPAQTQAIRVQIGPGDTISYLPVIIDYDHHQLHEGEVFRWSVYVSSLASTNNKDIRIVVPNISLGGANPVTKCPHFRFEVVADGFAQAFLYEAPTVTGNGTQRNPIAMERNGTYTPKLEIHEDPTITGVGTMIWQGLILASKNSSGNTEASIMEFVLKNNTTYLFRVTSGTAGLKVLIRFMWYEDLGV